MLLPFLARFESRSYRYLRWTNPEVLTYRRQIRQVIAQNPHWTLIFAPSPTLPISN